MNYRHAFHAGNHADILKHAVMLACLERMTQKPTPMAVLDAFAGAGVYDLTAAEAIRSPEWRDGIGKLQEWADAPPLVSPLICAARSGRYLGSPRLILDHLRPQDRLIACDLHPEEFAKLRSAIGGDSRAHLHLRDGYGALSALLPPPEKRGLVLLDPPYEAVDELERSVAALAAGVSRFRQGVYVWWRLFKPGVKLDALDKALADGTGLAWLRADLAIADPRATTRMVASSVLVLNPPFGLEATLRAVLAPIASRLDLGGGSWRITGS